MTDDYTWYKHELGTYRVEPSRFGTYKSILEDGTEMVTGLTEQDVRVATEYIHLPFYYGSDASDVKTIQANVTTAVDL